MTSESREAQPLSGEDKFRRKYPLGIEKDFEKKYGHFPTPEEMGIEIRKLIKAGKWKVSPVSALRPR